MDELVHRADEDEDRRDGEQDADRDVEQQLEADEPAEQAPSGTRRTSPPGGRPRPGGASWLVIIGDYRRRWRPRPLLSGQCARDRSLPPSPRSGARPRLPAARRTGCARRLPRRSWRRGTRRSCGWSRACKRCEDGDPYVPIDVNVLFGNDEVVLRGPWDRVNVVKIAPTAGDLSSGRVDYHLDFPGDALNPGCTYADWSRRLEREGAADGVRARRDRRGASREARAAVLVLLRLQRLQQPARGRLGDDPAQLRRGDARAGADAAARRRSATASTRAPSAHAGTTPSSRRSTARTRSCTRRPVRTRTSIRQALFLGRSAAQGVGCDDTEGPYEQLRPTVAVVPSATAAYLAEYPVARLPGPLGRAAAGVLQRPHRPEHEVPVDGADHLVDELARTAASPSRAARRSARARRSSSAAPSPPARMCSRRSCATRSRARSRWPRCSPSCSLRPRARPGAGRRRCGSRRRRAVGRADHLGQADVPAPVPAVRSASACSSSRSASSIALLQYVALPRRRVSPARAVGGRDEHLGRRPRVQPGTDLHRRRARVRPGRDRVRDGRASTGAST